MALSVSPEEKQRLQAGGAKVSRKLKPREKPAEPAGGMALAQAVSESNARLAVMFEAQIERQDAIINAVLAENRELRGQLLAVQQGQVDLQRELQALRERPVRLKPKEGPGGAFEYIDVIPLKAKEPVRH